MANWFYIPQKGQRQGPVSTRQLKRLAASGQLQPVDLIWREGMGRWVPARKVQGLVFGSSPEDGANRTPPQPAGAEEKATATPPRSAQEADWRSALPPRRFAGTDTPSAPPIEPVVEDVPQEPVVLPLPLAEAPPADVPIASWHNDLPPVRNLGAVSPLDIPMEPVFVDVEPVSTPAPPVYEVPETPPVKPTPPPRRKKSARKSETKKAEGKKQEVKNPEEQPLFCPRCRRANPSFAIFCHFDGAELRPVR
jgi:hypothetical protein